MFLFLMTTSVLAKYIFLPSNVIIGIDANLLMLKKSAKYLLNIKNMYI